MKKLLTLFLGAVLVSFSGNVSAQDNGLTSNDQIVGKSVSFLYLKGYFEGGDEDKVHFFDEDGKLVAVKNSDVLDLYPELFDSKTVFKIGDYYVLGDSTSVKEGNTTRTTFWTTKYLPFTTSERTYFMLCENSEGNREKSEESNRNEKKRKFWIFSSYKFKTNSSSSTFTKTESLNIPYYSGAIIVEE